MESKIGSRVCLKGWSFEDDSTQADSKPLVHFFPIQVRGSSLPVFCFLCLFLSGFLDSFSHLYKRVCLSVGPSVGPSVRPSVRPTRVEFLRNGLNSNKIASGT